MVEPLYSELYDRVSYSSNLDYIINSNILEYDISKGNISVLLYQGIIDEKTYWDFYYMPKEERVVKVGMMQRNDRKINDAIIGGFREAKRLFFEANRIQNDDIQSIRNDAVFLIDKLPQYTNFGPIQFVLKNEYTEYFKVGKKDYYYYYNSITGKEILDIKGISKNILPLHERYMLEFIKAVFWSVQMESIDSTIEMIKEFDDAYLNYELDSGYYRRLDSESKFQTKLLSKYNIYKLDYLLNENEKTYLDISYNYRIISDLYRICSNIYLMRNRFNNNKKWY